MPSLLSVIRLVSYELSKTIQVFFEIESSAEAGVNARQKACILRCRASYFHYICIQFFQWIDFFQNVYI